MSLIDTAMAIDVNQGQYNEKLKGNNTKNQ